MQVLNWQVIIEEHGPIVWQTAYRLLGNHAETADCFQETFLCALDVSQRQRVRNFPALLVRLATTRAIDRLRERLRRSRHEPGFVERATVRRANPSPDRQAQLNELATTLRDALAELPSQEAKAFCLRYLNDMSYRQIARELHIKTNAAGVLLHRAKAKLRGLLDSLEATDEVVP
ncbi:MAG: sigma-70 family RNA polymerase sigma factor [Phycisphaerales bacterium]|nr:MAG: sigma-70 family RNA polymerase sigma factor [Phycisphaerales bacterium]